MLPNGRHRSDNATKSKEKGKQASLTSKGVTCADDAPSRGVPAAATIQYFNAVLVPDSEKGGKSEIEKQEEDEIAAFLPMLQEYLKRMSQSRTPSIFPMISLIHPHIS